MPVISPERRELAIELRKQGKSVREIVIETGLSESSVRRFAADYIPKRGPRKPNGSTGEKKCVMSWEFRAEWTEEINKLRRLAGKRPFPLPAPNDTRSNER